MLLNPFSVGIQETYIKNDELDNLLLLFYIDQKKNSKGRIATNRGGWQSNDVDLKNSTIQKFIYACMGHIQEYVSNFNFAKNYDINVTNLWFNCNKNKDYNKMHNHAGCDFSACYYLKVPKNSGNFVLENPNPAFTSSSLYRNSMSHYNEYNSGSYNIEAKENKLIVFPSYVYHSVEPNMTDEDRISIAFNMCVTFV
jgi:uncharacterized protein (TIGR02466 family)